jgi:hypothetical protein
MVEERDLERLAAQLGRDAHDHIDADRIATRVVARLHEQDRRGRPSWRRMSWIALAAAVAGLLIGITVFSREENPVVTAERVDYPVPLVLEELSTAQLSDVLDSLTFEAPVHEIQAVGFEDLNEPELRELLQMLEG